MDRPGTIEAVGGILGTLADGVSASTWDYVLGRSVIPDDAGRQPGADAYVNNYDPDWAAAELVAVKLLQTMGTTQLVEWSSEGSRFKSNPAELAALESRLRERSLIGRVLGNTLTKVDVITEGTGYDPRSGAWPDRRRLGVIGNWS